MEYEDCLSYLRRLGNEVLTMKFGLDAIGRLTDGLANPQDRFASVLVAGTNGKGSVSRFLSAMSCSAGIRTGLFTSPHLVNLTERVQIDGREVDRETFASAFAEVISTIELLQLETHPTFFEVVTATAFLCFARSGIDLAVLEIGMGGRLDSTNIVDPLLSLITPISFDHQQYLGNALSEIAAEKAGIMRDGRLTLSALQPPEADATLRSVALEKGAHLEFVIAKDVPRWADQQGRFRFQHGGSTLRMEACGPAQVENALLAIRAAEELRNLGFAIDSRAISKAVRETVVPGVQWRLRENPTVLLDGAHNPAAARTLADYVAAYTTPPRTLVFGIMKDKDAASLLATLGPLFETVFMTRVDSPRAAEPEALVRLCPMARPFHSATDAFRTACAKGETVVVAGSFFLVGEILHGLEDS